MTRDLTLIRTLLRKDVQLFWPFASLTAALFAFTKFPAVMAALGPVAGLVQVAMQFGFVLLILVVFYEDAVVSLKHDWLTRPISGTTVLFEKSLFVFLALIAPGVLGAFFSGLVSGHSLAESAFTGIGDGAGGNTLLLAVVIMAFASVTANIRQAFIVLLAAIAAIALVAALASRFFDSGDSIGLTPSLWVVGRIHQVVPLVAAIAVLWVQYRYRHTRASRVIAGATIAIGLGTLAAMSWPRIFAVQKLLASETAAPESTKGALGQGCFPSRRSNGFPGMDPDRTPEPFRRAEGELPIAFTTRLTGLEPSADRKVVVDHVIVSWRSAGKTLFRQAGGQRVFRGLMSEKAPDTERIWLLQDAEFKRLAAVGDIETRVDYSLSVLEPVASVELVVGGGRSYHAGIGWCEATQGRTRGDTLIDCYKAGPQPAQLVGNLVGAPESAAKVSRRMDFTPAALDFWGGERHRIPLHSDEEAARVKVTAYRPLAHFDRQFVIPGVLGGPVSACPAP